MVSVWRLASGLAAPVDAEGRQEILVELEPSQFMPLVVTPQLLLCGIFVPRDQMAGWLQAISNALPMTYSLEALLDVGVHPEPRPCGANLAVVVGVIVAALVLGALTLRRRTT